MIDWSLLSKKFGAQNEPPRNGKLNGPKRFEQLALTYVKDVYRQYKWLPTNESHDGNKDGHTGKDAEFDVWEEAKYKRNLDSLKRQDIDPTILSGQLQGNVRLIIFVTNSRIPEALISRAIMGARIKEIEVSCVFGKQLEGWLYRHPELYDKYFEEAIPPQTDDEQVIEITDSAILEIFSTDFASFQTRRELLAGEIYLLSITIYSSREARGRLCLDSAPINVIEQDDFCNPNGFVIKEGLEVYLFLIRPSGVSANGVNVRIEINGHSYFRMIDGVLIQKSVSYKIAYNRQLKLISSVKDAISNTPFDSLQYIIALYAESGLGKSYVLKSIYSDFVLKHDMSIVTFEPSEQNGINSILLCKIILFLNYGNVFWNQLIKTFDDIRAFADIAIKYNTKTVFSDDMIRRIIEGCFNAETAAGVIEDLMIYSGQNGGVLVQGNKTKLPRILLLDDFQYLDSRQAQLVSILCEQTVSKRSTVIIISATKNRFRDDVTKAVFERITPNVFELEGLELDDKVTTLQAAFDLPFEDARVIADKILPDAPLLVSDVLRIINSSKPERGCVLDVLLSYHRQASSVLILKNRFNNLDSQYYLLDIIYRFKRGISQRVLLEYSGFDASVTADDIKRLFEEGLILKSDNLLSPYHDYYVQSYKQLRKSDFYNERTGEFLSYLFYRGGDAGDSDQPHLLSQLIRCGKDYFNTYEENIKNTIKASFNSTNFSTALYFCQYYHEQIDFKKNSLTSEELRYMYMYAYCLVHCSRENEASEMLEKIYNLAPTDSVEKLESGAELLNQWFWGMKLEKLIGTSFTIQRGAEQLLKLPQSEDDGQRLKKARSTAYNRRMVTLLMLDEYEDAKSTFREFEDIVKAESEGTEYRPRIATKQMDYARGISYQQPALALELMEEALRNFKRKREQHFRRILLCEIDTAVLISVARGEFLPNIFHEFLPMLQRCQFNSEYFKALLKYYACKLIDEARYISAQATAKDRRYESDTTEEMQKEIYRCIADTGLTPRFKDKFLMDNLQAFAYIKAGDYRQALECLQCADDFISPAGESYRLISAHNINNLKLIRKIAWGTKCIGFPSDTYLLDCRFW